ncbi:MAG: hypothetical protein OEZ43_02355 [Gammaproteobacteria bacterium]|nr:hypothetical protein [Gammaproteobacteria bacterium]
MEKIITLQPNTSLQVDTTLIQRGVYLALGFGVIMTAMVDPPILMKWMAAANIFGILLVSLAILGKRLTPKAVGSRYLPEPSLVTNTLGLLLGLGLSIFAIAHPPAATIWAFYAHTVAIVLVIQAILGYDVLLRQQNQVQGKKVVDFYMNSPTRSNGHGVPKAA